MSRIATFSKAVLVAASVYSSPSALAGGIERKAQSMDLLFEPGNYIFSSVSVVTPSVDGVESVGGPTGNILESYESTDIAVKYSLNNQLDLLVQYEQPYGAATRYGPSSILLNGTSINATSHLLSTLVRYRAGKQTSFIAGVGLSRFSGNAALNGPVFNELSGYSAELNNSHSTGYILGFAFEIPEKKLRTLLSYRSEISHRHKIIENHVLTAEELTITLPQSVRLDIQSGISTNTLLFGSIDWKRWSDFEVAPPFLTASTGQELIDFEDDTTTFSLGITRRISPNWAISFQLQHEDAANDTRTPFGPVNGLVGWSAFATHQVEQTRFTIGYGVTSFGDATATINNAPVAQFADNEATGIYMGFGQFF